MIKLVELQRDQYTLRGLYHEVENAKALVVMFHGFTGHLNEHNFFFKNFAEEMEKIGIASLRYDFMGSGMSDGHFNEMTFLTELEDARAIINHALEIKGNAKLVVLGFSMGGAVAAKMGGEFQDKIDKLILLSPAGDMDKIARAYLINPAYKHYDDQNIDMGGYLIGLNFAHTLKDYDLYEGVGRYPNNVLIVHGELDKAVPIEYGRRYKEQYQNVEFHEIPGGDHGYNTMAMRAQVNKIVLDFIEK